MQANTPPKENAREKKREMARKRERRGKEGKRRRWNVLGGKGAPHSLTLVLYSHSALTRRREREKKG